MMQGESKHHFSEALYVKGVTFFSLFPRAFLCQSADCLRYIHSMGVRSRLCTPHLHSTYRFEPFHL